MIRWNPSATEFLPEYMKIVYMALYETVNELARDAEKSQGRDTINFLKYIQSFYLRLQKMFKPMAHIFQSHEYNLYAYVFETLWKPTLIKFEILILILI